ncbi:MAG: hypothetical protein K8R68_06970, partial [Bacteroidales bacterium]|nr:hypothetical protein [Bacteroidales bacterium]
LLLHYLLTIMLQYCYVVKERFFNLNFVFTQSLYGWVTEKPAGRALARICELIRLRWPSIN